MKGIMRKRLLALLSAAGLAGTATSVSSQVLKGDQAEKTKTESTVKTNKAQREHAAVQSKDVDKSSKAVAEQKAAQDVVNEKVGPDHVVHKHIAGVKYEDAASKDAAKMTKVRKESTATQDSQIKKAKTGAAESSVVKTDAGKKYRKAGSEQDALTVKQKVGENATIQRKAGGTQQENATTAGKVKLEKNAAESDASKKAATIKLTKGAAGANAAQSQATKKMDQASPK